MSTQLLSSQNISTSSKHFSLLLFVLCRRKNSGMMDLFRERSSQKLKPVIQRNKKADRVKGERDSPARKTVLLFFMFHPSGSHYFPPLSPSRQRAALSPARTTVLLPSTEQRSSPQKHCGFAGFRAENRWSISSLVWLKEAG